jgi:hypothetical protein
MNAKRYIQNQPKHPVQQNKYPSRDKITIPDGVRPATYQRAIELIGNRQRIERLLTSARFKYSNRSEQWYGEKIIYDIERDCGA